MEWAKGLMGNSKANNKKRSGEGEDLLGIYLVRGKNKDGDGPLNWSQGGHHVL